MLSGNKRNLSEWEESVNNTKYSLSPPTKRAKIDNNGHNNKSSVKWPKKQNKLTNKQ